LGFVLSLTFLFAGFSQIIISSFKISDGLIILTFFTLLIKGKFKITLIILFFFLSFIYAWIIGDLDNIKSLISAVMVFSIVFSLINHFSKRGIIEIEYYLKLFVFSFFLSNILALSIFLLFPEFKSLVVDVSSIGVRFKGFFTQANGYAYVLLLNFPISLYFLVKNRNIYNISNVLLITVCLFLSQSRGAILSIIIGLFFIYSIYILKNGKLSKIIIPSILFFGTGYLILAFLPSLLLDNYGINLSRLNPISQKESERDLTSFNFSDLEEDRFYLIRAGFETISVYPFGLGYQDHHNIIGETTGIYLIPHNFFISIILTYGIPIGLIWIIFVIYLIWRGLIKMYFERISPHDLFFYLLSMIIIVTLFYFSHSSDWSYFYFLLGIYVALLNIKVNPVNI
jgi:O-antigen ligase